MTAVEQQVKKKGPNLWLSIFIFITGAVLASLGVMMLANSLLGAITEDAFDIPGGEERDFDAGNFDVYVSSGDIFAPVDDIAADAQDVTITNIDTGDNLAITPLSADIPIGRGQTNFLAIATFEVTEPGRYQIAVASEVGGLAFVSTAIPTSFSEVQTHVFMLGAGTVIALIGAVMLIVGVIRRSRAEREAKTQAARQQGAVAGQFQQPPATTQSAPSHAAQPPQAQPPQGQPPAPPTSPPSSGTADSATPWDN